MNVGHFGLERVCEPRICLFRDNNTMCLQTEMCEGINLTSPLNSARRRFKLYFLSFPRTYSPSASSIFLSVCLLLSQRSSFFFFFSRSCCCCRVKMWFLQNVSCYESMKKRRFESLLSPAKFKRRVSVRIVNLYFCLSHCCISAKTH